jgi:hypothetical protein
MEKLTCGAALPLFSAKKTLKLSKYYHVFGFRQKKPFFFSNFIFHSFPALNVECISAQT